MKKKTVPRDRQLAKIVDKWNGDLRVAPAPLVVTVRVAGVPGFTELGLIAHCGASGGAGDTEQVRDIVPLNPLAATKFNVEVADSPEFTLPGVSADAEMVKSGVCVEKRPVWSVLFSYYLHAELFASLFLQATFMQLRFLRLA